MNMTANSTNDQSSTSFSEVALCPEQMLSGSQLLQGPPESESAFYVSGASSDLTRSGSTTRISEAETHRSSYASNPRTVWDLPSSNGGIEVDSLPWSALLESAKIPSKSVSSEVFDGSHTTMQGSGRSSSNAVSSSHTVTANKDGSKDGGFTPPSSHLLQTMPSNSAEPPRPIAVVEREQTEPPRPIAVVERAQRGGRGRGPQFYNGQPHYQQHHQGSFHDNNNNGVRRDHTRGGRGFRSNVNGNWNYSHNRGFNHRDATAYFQPRSLGFVPIRGYIPSPHNPYPHLHPPFIQPNPYMETYETYSYISHPKLMYVPPPPPPIPILPIPRSPCIPTTTPMPQHNLPSLSDEELAKLNTRIVNQINYYFSDKNLGTDTFLRKQMDPQGWVPIKTIAEFRLVKNITDNITKFKNITEIDVVLNAIKSSQFMEVKGNKIRRREDFEKWTN